MVATESRKRHGVGVCSRVTCWWYRDGQGTIDYTLVEGYADYSDDEPNMTVLYSRLDSDMVWKRCGVRREEVSPEIRAMLEVFWYITN